MRKTAISVTLAPENLLWLQGQALAKRSRSLSAALDQVLAEARTTGQRRPIRSVVGTLRIDRSDPDLRGADAAVRALFHASLRRGRPPRQRSTGATRPRRG